MSTQTLSLELNNYVFNGLFKIALNSTHNSFFSDAARSYVNRGNNPQSECTRLIKSWMDLNERTYDAEYNEEANPTPLSYFFEPKLCAVDSAHQLVKYLQCIECNIDSKLIDLTDQEAKDLQFLNDLISDPLKSIVKSTPEWINAKWAA